MTATDSPAFCARGTGFRTDEEFERLCPRLTIEERELLVASIVTHGVREPLVVWREEKLLLDGHTRLAICEEHDVPYEVIEYSFPDRAAARHWIVDNALARRNLSEEQQRYLRGKRLLVERKDPAATQIVDGRPPQVEAAGPRTSERIAKATGVSRATVERDAQYAADIDAIAEAAGAEAKDAILAGEVKLTRQEARRVAAAAPRSLAEVEAAAKPLSLADLNRLAGGTTSSRADERDHVAAINALALRTSAALRAYAKSGARAADRERLTELWDLRSDIERLLIYLEGEK